MKTIGIVGRSYYNIDNREIIQLNIKLLNAIKDYEEITTMVLVDNNDDKKNHYIMSLCDGFIIPGGTSFSSFDEEVINYSIKYNKPLIGICAGFQAICSMFSLNRDKLDMTKLLPDNSHYNTNHKNKILPNTILSKILKSDVITVNSLHHSYIDGNIKGLKISSLSDDNIIEAIELENHPFFIGVQWHPEYLMDDNSKKIFDYFIKTIKNVSL